MIETQNSILRLRPGLMVSEVEPSKLNPSTPLRIDGERSRTIKIVESPQSGDDPSLILHFDT